MDIRVLRYFVKVAYEKNISRAAKKLFVSQPALSKQLKELEEELGVELFERGSRNIKLTDDGYFLLSQANEIISLMDKTVNNITSKQQNIGGEIHIGAGETKGIKEITKVLKNFMKDYPNVKVHFFSGDVEAVLEKLENGVLDFGIILDDLPKKDFNFLKLPYRDVVGVITQKNGIFSKHTAITPKDLKEIPVIISNQMFKTSMLENWAGNYFSSINIIGTYNLLYNGSLIVEDEIAHAITIDGIINTENSNLKFIPFEPPIKADLNLIWKKYTSLSRMAREFLKYCEKSFK